MLGNLLSKLFKKSALHEIVQKTTENPNPVSSEYQTCIDPVKKTNDNDLPKSEFNVPIFKDKIHEITPGNYSISTGYIEENQCVYGIAYNMKYHQDHIVSMIYGNRISGKSLLKLENGCVIVIPPHFKDLSYLHEFIHTDTRIQDCIVHNEHAFYKGRYLPVFDIIRIRCGLNPNKNPFSRDDSKWKL